MPRLSVITINFNNHTGLEKTIKSLEIQIFKDFEYIIIDGASTDGSLEIIRKYNFEDISGYHWISEPDKGVYEAMNKGIYLAGGEYLLFLNSGDFLVNEHVLEKVFFGSRSSDFILGRCNISDNGMVVHTTNPPEKITFSYLYYSGLAHQSTFIKREIFLKYGYYREDFKYNSDIEFWYRTMILQACITETLPVIISDYNLDGISSKENQTNQYRIEMAEIYSHPVLQKFVPDYEEWAKYRQEMKLMDWARSKKVLYLLLSGLFRLACWFTVLKK